MLSRFYSHNKLKHKALETLEIYWDRVCGESINTDSLYMPFNDIKRECAKYSKNQKLSRALRSLCKDNCIKSEFPLEGQRFVRYRLLPEGEKALSDGRFKSQGLHEWDSTFATFSVFLSFLLGLIGAILGIINYMQST